MNEYEEAYEVLFNMAKAKMVMNAHKGFIHNVSYAELQDFMQREIEELTVACSADDSTKIIEESADIVNFCVGVVARAMQNYRNREKVEEQMDLPGFEKEEKEYQHET